MVKEFALRRAMTSTVPISRFNRGEANHIFDEVKEEGCKMVVKNNVPTCVLLAPERFDEIIEAVEDLYLLRLSEDRIRRDDGIRWSFEDILAEDGLTIADIDAMEDVELV